MLDNNMDTHRHSFDTLQVEPSNLSSPPPNVLYSFFPWYGAASWAALQAICETYAAPFYDQRLVVFSDTRVNNK